MVTGFGLTEEMIGAGYFTVTEADPVADGNATDVAWTVTVDGEGGAAGAVYKPLALTKPTAELPPSMPFTAHVTD